MARLKLTGDVHLGKKFQQNVPLHRRGDREKMQWEQLERELMDCDGADAHIQMGDIFDGFVVSFAVIMRLVELYKRARAKNPNVRFGVLRGNHDADRDLDRVSAFDVLAELLAAIGVVVAKDEPVEILPGHWMIPWHPIISAQAMVNHYADRLAGAAAVFGHWDVVMGEENRCPAQALAQLGVGAIYTGHDHLPRIERVDGVDVFVVGSMQPYSHAEDPGEIIYVTRTLAEVRADPNGFAMKALRVVLDPGETFDLQIDCLQLQVTRGKVEAEEVDLGEVQFEAFDLNELFAAACRQIGLDAETQALTSRRLEEERAARA
jgi:hypothetical protein